MEIEKSKVLIKFLLNFRQSGDVLFFLNVRRLRGYTATDATDEEKNSITNGLTKTKNGKRTYLREIQVAYSGKHEAENCQNCLPLIKKNWVHHFLDKKLIVGEIAWKNNRLNKECF